MRHLGYVLLLASVTLMSCGDSKEETTKPLSPRVKKTTKITSPNQNQELIRGTSIPFNFTTDGGKIDSVQVVVGDETFSFESSSFEVALPTRKVGTWSLRSKVFCAGESETHIRKVIVFPEEAPEEMIYNVIRTYPHDTDDYTRAINARWPLV